MVAAKKLGLGARGAAGLCLYLCLGSCAAGAAADVLTLASILADDMVLPERSNLWGTAVPRSRVAVTIAAGPGAPLFASSTVTNASGAWMLGFQVAATGLTPATVTVSSGAAKRTLQRVLFGKVVLCAGQVRFRCPFYVFSHRADLGPVCLIWPCKPL